MKILVKIILITIVLCYNTPLLAQESSRYVDVVLKDFTNIDLEIAPLLGTRLLFPVSLDETDSEIPFTLDLTNAGLFQITRHADRNYFVISAPHSQEAKNQGSLFLAVAGRYVSIRLSIGSPDTHIEELRFSFGEKEKEILINTIVKKKLSKLEHKFKQDLITARKEHCQSEQDLVAARLANQTKTDNIHIKTSNEYMDIYIDSIIAFKEHKNLVLEIHTKENIAIETLSLNSNNDNQTAQLLSSTFACVKKKEKINYCSVGMNKGFALDKYSKLDLVVHTSTGRHVLSW